MRDTVFVSLARKVLKRVLRKRVLFVESMAELFEVVSRHPEDLENHLIVLNPRRVMADHDKTTRHWRRETNRAGDRLEDVVTPEHPTP